MEPALSGIMFIRLVTGEDIIAEVDYFPDDNENIKIYNPLKVVYMANPGKPGLYSISFMQWVFSKLVKNQEYVLSFRDVLLLNETTDYVKNYYNETVNHFGRTPKSPTMSTADMIKELEESITRMMEDAEKIAQIEKDAEKFVVDYFSNMTSSNNKGTLH
jgi:ABC-type uncharacterized transport system YnjBCD substrate-binding protein